MDTDKGKSDVGVVEVPSLLESANAISPLSVFIRVPVFG
jgi:hypothetical protein